MTLAKITITECTQTGRHFNHHFNEYLIFVWMCLNWPVLWAQIATRWTLSARTRENKVTVEPRWLTKMSYCQFCEVNNITKLLVSVIVSFQTNQIKKEENFESLPFHHHHFLKPLLRTCFQIHSSMFSANKHGINLLAQWVNSYINLPRSSADYTPPGPNNTME